MEQVITGHGNILSNVMWWIKFFWNIPRNTLLNSSRKIDYIQPVTQDVICTYMEWIILFWKLLYIVWLMKRKNHYFGWKLLQIRIEIVNLEKQLPNTMNYLIGEIFEINVLQFFWNQLHFDLRQYFPTATTISFWNHFILRCSKLELELTKGSNLFYQYLIHEIL